MKKGARNKPTTRARTSAATARCAGCARARQPTAGSPCARDIHRRQSFQPRNTMTVSALSFSTFNLHPLASCAFFRLFWPFRSSRRVLNEFNFNENFIRRIIRGNFLFLFFKTKKRPSRRQHGNWISWQIDRLRTTPRVASGGSIFFFIIFFCKFENHFSWSSC